MDHSSGATSTRRSAAGSGPTGLGDGFWGSFDDVPDEAGVSLSLSERQRSVFLTGVDQRGEKRPGGGQGDIGAIER